MRIICRVVDHDWEALTYPPTPRRWECHRCHDLTEEAPFEPR